MRFEVNHETIYEYPSQVSLDPHVFRMRPRSDVAQRLVSFELAIEPAPRGTSEGLDRDGNDVTHAWFEGPTQRLAVRSAFVVETLRRNPFDYVLHPPEQARLPVAYPAEMGAVLQPFLAGTGSAEVGALAGDVAAGSGGDTVPFLDALCRRLRRDVRGVVRREGGPLDPDETLRRREGACRDITVLFMDACRSQGIAARFVSGYALPGPGVPERELHAWAEVYLAGAGWRGFDPTSGFAVADRHVAVAAGRTPRDAAPVEGTYRSDVAHATLRTRIGMKVDGG